MSKDRYSDSHTINVFGDLKDLTIRADGTDSDIRLNADSQIRADADEINLVSQVDCNIHAGAGLVVQSGHDLKLDSLNGPVIINGGSFPEGQYNYGVEVVADVGAMLIESKGGSIETTAHGQIASTCKSFRITNMSSAITNPDKDWSGLVVKNRDGNSGYIARFAHGWVEGSDNNWLVEITDEGRVKCKSLKISEGAFEGAFLKSNQYGVASWVTSEAVLGSPTGGEAYIALHLEDNRQVDIWAPLDVNITAGDDIYLAADDNIYLTAEDNIILTGADGVTLTAGAGSSDEIQVNMAGGKIEALGDQSGSDGFIMSLTNTAEYPDGLEIKFPGEASVAHSDNWIRFSGGGKSRGAIQGTWGLDESNYTYNTTYDVTFVRDVFQTKITIGDDVPDGAPHDPGEVLTHHEHLTGQKGSAMFVSGFADFGEFIEVGDINEWPERGQKTWKLGLPEGYVVWVNNNKFYKESKGTSTPMVVTDRAIVLGNGLPAVKGSGVEATGEVLSFIGQLPVFITGPSKNGDLLIPVADENFCRCISKDEITFQEYMSAVGTAWEDREDPGENTLHRVMCAIGKK